MPYTLQQHLEDEAGSPARLVELTDRLNTGAIDLAVLARAQAAADGWIDAHLRKFSAADLTALRLNPTPTIIRIAAAETIFQLRAQMPMGVSESDIELHKARMAELQALGADSIRVGDTKTARASFIENDGEVSRKNWGW